MQLPQQTAPYLEALTSYAFRDPTRFHVPGHKGGPGADAGLRHAMGEAALTLDVPQGIEEIDTGSPPAPRLRTPPGRRSSSTRRGVPTSAFTATCPPRRSGWAPTPCSPRRTRWSAR